VNCGKGRDSGRPPVSQLADQEVLQIREMIDRDYLVKVTFDESGDEHQAVDGFGLLSWVASPPRPAGPWTTNSYQCSHPQGPAKAIAARRNKLGTTAVLRPLHAEPRKDIEWVKKHPRS